MSARATIRPESRDRHASSAWLMLALAEMAGDQLRIDLARATLNECGYPGGEGAPSIDEAMAAINAREAAERAAESRT